MTSISESKSVRISLRQNYSVNESGRQQQDLSEIKTEIAQMKSLILTIEKIALQNEAPTHQFEHFLLHLN